MTNEPTVGPEGQAIVIAKTPEIDWTEKVVAELETIDLTNAENELVSTPHTDNMQGQLLAADCPDGTLLCKKDTPYPDGLAGVGTKEALMWFQESVGLTPDAVCGPKTWTALILS